MKVTNEQQTLAQKNFEIEIAKLRWAETGEVSVIENVPEAHTLSDTPKTHTVEVDDDYMDFHPEDLEDIDPDEINQERRERYLETASIGFGLTDPFYIMESRHIPQSWKAYGAKVSPMEVLDMDNAEFADLHGLRAIQITLSYGGPSDEFIIFQAKRYIQSGFGSRMYHTWETEKSMYLYKDWGWGVGIELDADQTALLDDIYFTSEDIE